MKCEGYTRPECEPCPNTSDHERVKIETATGVEKKYLCQRCIDKLLNPLIGAWEYD